MINGIGVLGYGVGGIDAEAAMLGQPLATRIPAVVGVRLYGVRRPVVTATDLVLLITERLRAHGVVGCFVEFFGPGLDKLSIGDRLTIANMSPEFGATCAYFPIDRSTIDYLRLTGRCDEQVALVEYYAREQLLWHDPTTQPRYSDVVELDLGGAVPAVAGPRRPQDRVPLANAPDSLRAALTSVATKRPTPTASVCGDREITDGDVVIAAITSCTNTANPASMLAAGLLARNAVRRDLRTKPGVKTTLSPGSHSVTAYLSRSGLTNALERLGFHVAGYGCMTCIGGSGELIDDVAEQVRARDLSVVAVLSGNRNFDGRINPDVRLSYLASPALVVAYALTGRFDIDLTRDPLGTDLAGRPVLLEEIWPDAGELDRLQTAVVDERLFRTDSVGLLHGASRWNALDAGGSERFPWPESTYLLRPPFLDGVARVPDMPADIHDAGVLLKLGDSITTDHFSPAGRIPRDSPAGRYLVEQGVPPGQLSSYAARRGNHEVMMRGAFANARIQNALVPGVVGGFTRNFACGGVMSDVYTAAMAALHSGSPRIVLAGREYGTGSSRDWAAKCTALLGVRAVLAESFERIHRANLVGMGVLPLEYPDGVTASSLGLTGFERITITGVAAALDETRTVRMDADGTRFEARVRIDTQLEADYFRHGGVLPAVLRQMLDTADEMRHHSGRGPVLSL